MTSKWDDRYLALAEHVATWSRDPSTQVGAVIVRPDKTVASVGFNGFPRGVVDSEGRLADRDWRLAATVHAEMNAILHAREVLNFCTLYVWPFQPCAACAAAIVQSGISRIVSPIADAERAERWRRSFETAQLLFSEAGVTVDLKVGVVARAVG